MNNLLFAQVYLKPIDKLSIANQLLKIQKKFWFWDEYRSTSMLPLMTKDSIQGKQGASNSRDGDFKWVPYVPLELKLWFEEEVFPWMGSKTRIMALVTQPNFSNNEHIDCDHHEIGSRQHKFRVVLQGRSDSLYFKTLNGDVKAPDTDHPFIMDGGWPHGMNNSSSITKVTIAAGAPWNGLDQYHNIDVLMKRSDHLLPSDVVPYLKKNV